MQVRRGCQGDPMQHNLSYNRRVGHPCYTISIVLILCFVCTPALALSKRGEENFRQGIKYERAQQWDRAAQEFTLAVAADPSNTEYQLHYRRSLFNASQP